MEDKPEEFHYENPIVDILCAEDVPPDYFIFDWFLQGTLVVLAGEPAVGKSYVSYTIALATASGRPALSGFVPEAEPRTVIYFDQENSTGDRNKYLTRSWRGLVDSQGEPPDVGLLHQHFIPVHFRLGDANWEATAEQFILHFKPRLIVFDTAASAFDIENENDNAEASKTVRSLRRLMALTDPVASCLVLKHAKSHVEKGGERRIRGATMWKSLVDQTIFHVKSQGRPRKGGLHLTRLLHDKKRAYGLTETVYITPSYTDEDKKGLVLEGSKKASSEHRRAELAEGLEDDD